MTRRRTLTVVRHMTETQLAKAIKMEKAHARIVRRLLFIELLYKGVSVPKASRMINVSKKIGYLWLKRWNDLGRRGLDPKFSPGGPTKITQEQMSELKKNLYRKSWPVERVRRYIKDKFSTDYSPRQVARIMKKMKMRNRKPHHNASRILRYFKQ